MVSTVHHMSLSVVWEVERWQAHFMQLSCSHHVHMLGGHLSTYCDAKARCYGDPYETRCSRELVGTRLCVTRVMS